MRLKATKWCADNSMDTKSLFKILKIPPPVINRDLVNRARAKQLECPFRMGGGANFSLIHALLDSVGARKVIETGVAYGWSSLARF